MKFDRESVATEVHGYLQSFGWAVQCFRDPDPEEDDGGVEFSDPSQLDPKDANRFVVVKPEVSVNINGQDGKLELESAGDMFNHPLHKMLKNLANKTPGLDFDYSLKNRSIRAKSQEHEDIPMAEIAEGLGAMSGSARTSYQPLESVKIIVKHRKPVNEESRGSRSRNIHSIFIQSGEERFRLKENSLGAARAMARHVASGGAVYDSVGEQIQEMAKERRQLQDFVRYVSRSGLINETNQQYVEVAQENIQNIARTLTQLTGAKTYATAVENMSQWSNTELLNDSVDLSAEFAEFKIDERVTQAVDSLKRAISRKSNWETAIQEAIKTEDFGQLREQLTETENMDWATPQAKLSHQVSQMSQAAASPMLSTHLQNISKKIMAGGQLSQFEYGTIKSCLLSANEPQTKQPPAAPIEEEYISFLNSYII
jgi:hypothetical protein